MASQLDNPSGWATGGEPPTEKQAAFLKTLASSKGADVDPSSLNKSEASMKINELKNAETKGGPSTAASSNAEPPIQNPDTWTTGDDQATGKQTGYIAAMAQKVGDQVKTEGMGKTEASKTIEELKEKTGM